MIYRGGTYIQVAAPLHKISVFIRQGADVDLGDLDRLYRESLERCRVKPDLKQLEQMEFGGGS